MQVRLYEKYQAEITDWLQRLGSDVSDEVYSYCTEDGALKESHELILDRPLPELVPHPNPLAYPADYQHGVLHALRYSKPDKRTQAGYSVSSGEVKWFPIVELNGHVLLFLLGELQRLAYTVKPLGMSLEQARQKRQANLEAIVEPNAPDNDDDF